MACTHDLWEHVLWEYFTYAPNTRGSVRTCSVRTPHVSCMHRILENLGEHILWEHVSCHIRMLCEDTRFVRICDLYASNTRKSVGTCSVRTCYVCIEYWKILVKMWHAMRAGSVVQSNSGAVSFTSQKKSTVSPHQKNSTVCIKKQQKFITRYFITLYSYCIITLYSCCIVTHV